MCLKRWTLTGSGATELALMSSCNLKLLKHLARPLLQLQVCCTRSSVEKCSSETLLLHLNTLHSSRSAMHVSMTHSSELCNADPT